MDERQLARLTEVARRRGYPDDRVTLGRLLAFGADLLTTPVGLTSARTLEQVVERVLVSALAVVRAVAVPPSHVADLGTGNGLPGVAAALAWPEATVLLVERRERKAEAVGELLDRHGIGNAEVLIADGREVLARRPALRGAVDLVTVRAVGAVEEVTRIVAPWVAPRGTIAHWKGRSLSISEVAAGERWARRQGFGKAEVLRFEDDAGPHRMVLFRKSGRKADG